jgi:lysophospholipase L1-like esterase
MPFLGMLLALGAVLCLWAGLGPEQAEAAAPPPPEETPVMLRTAVLPAAAPEPLPTPTAAPEPQPTPPGSGVYAVSARPDGNAVTPKDDQCYWGMELLDAGAQAHRCRFKSGSGQLLLDYDYGMAVPESEPVGPEWFSDAVFIGNSLEQGFMLYAGLKTADMFAVQSISVANIGTDHVINAGGGVYLTILDAMARKSYRKVFVMLGINELSWATKESFYTKYAGVIDKIRELEPEAELYLQSITPVTARQSDNSTTFTNPRIHEYNEVIRQLAEDKEAHYLYVFDALADEDGCLPAGSTDDGIHPYPKYYPQWLTYLESHTVTEVKR